MRHRFQSASGPARSLHGATRWLALLGCLAALGWLTSGCQSPSPDVTEAKFQTTESGLQYRIRREGTGRYPEPRSLLRLHYRGWLDDGTVFDSSYENNEPAAFVLSNMIEGWKEGLLLCREGGAIELIIPAELAYGSEGTGAIPPNATVHFLVEIVQVMKS
jgi:FKBP-type peptidyl-prolyl cis-trans isomerase FkpA